MWLVVLIKERGSEKNRKYHLASFKIEASIDEDLALVKHNGKYYVDVYGGSGKVINTTGVGG